jgi:hypothetical protein
LVEQLDSKRWFGKAVCWMTTEVAAAFMTPVEVVRMESFGWRGSSEERLSSVVLQEVLTAFLFNKQMNLPAQDDQCSRLLDFLSYVKSMTN